MVEFLIHFGITFDSFHHPGTGNNLQTLLCHGCSVQFSKRHINNNMGDTGSHLFGHLASMPAEHSPEFGLILSRHITNAGSHTHEQPPLCWAEWLDGQDLLGLGTGYHPVLVH